MGKTHLSLKQPHGLAAAAAVSVAEAVAAVVVVAGAAVFVEVDISFFVMPAPAAPWADALMTETVKDWDDTVEWLASTGSVGGLGKSRKVALGSTGIEDHLTSEEPSCYGPQEGNQPCALVRLKGCTESPIMDAFSPGGLHWASWSEMTKEPPSMRGLHAAGTENEDSWKLDVLFVGWTAERMVTWMNDWRTCYAATSCTRGAYPEEDLQCYRYAFCCPQCTRTGVLQMYWMERVDLLENYRNCPLNPRRIYHCCRNWAQYMHPWHYSSVADSWKIRLLLNCMIHGLRRSRPFSGSV